MMRNADPIQDLKIIILDLKRELAKVKEDNRLMKVKIRKLQADCSQRDRQIDTLLDPRKTAFVKKVVSDKGAAMIINLSEENKKLQKVLAEKECLIKRLQSDLQTKKTYSAKTEKRKQTSLQPKSILAIPYYAEQSYDTEKEKYKPEHNCKSLSMNNINHSVSRAGSSRTSPSESPRPFLSRRSVSADRAVFDKFGCNHSASINEDTKAQYNGLSREHLLSIIESLKSNQSPYSPRIRKGGSPESDLERNELQCDTPHQEIQQLQNYFMDMLTEVEHLKVTISKLKTEQNKTNNVLKKKDNNITKLAKEVKSLKRSKSDLRSASLKSKSLSSSSTRSKSSTSKKTRYLEYIPPGTALQEENVQVKQYDEKFTHETKIENPRTNTPVDVCSYKENQPEKEINYKIIHTRTMSVQTSNNDPINSPSSYNYKQPNEILSDTDNTSLNTEEEMRRTKYSALLRQMEENLFKSLTIHDQPPEFNM